MNSVVYRVVNGLGLHARASALVVAAIQTCAGEWEVIASARGRECNAASIMGLMMLAAGCGTEVEFLSLMPDEHWDKLTTSLESLFYINDDSETRHQRGRDPRYWACEQVFRKYKARHDLTCSNIHDELSRLSPQFDCGPFFERVASPSEAHISTERDAPELALDSVDVFVSYDSKDYAYATKIHNALTNAGLQVFLAHVSASKSGTTDFQKTIENALEKARSMILVATDSAHLEGGWVRAEWTTFLNEHRAGRKSGNLLIVQPTPGKATDLPVMLRMFQCEVIPQNGPLTSGQLRRIHEFLGIGSSRSDAGANQLLTHWFDGHEKPQRTGVFKRQPPAGPFSRWDGNAWHGDALTPEAAGQAAGLSAYQQVDWCGLIEP